MEEKETRTRPEGIFDPDRAAYMLAWRDRHIEKQRQIIEGYEQQLALMEALLAFALWQRASEEGAARVLSIPKRELSAMLSRYESEVENGEDAFTVRFFPKSEPQDGGEQDAP